MMTSTILYSAQRGTGPGIDLFALWSSLVPAMSRAALGAGADDPIIQVNLCPERALSDGPQPVDLACFAQMVAKLRQSSEAQAARV
jgi:3-deoxy-D-arabino-heptulosonate 7-phosphate (DAHP) synthase